MRWLGWTVVAAVILAAGCGDDDGGSSSSGGSGGTAGSSGAAGTGGGAGTAGSSGTGGAAGTAGAGGSGGVSGAAGSSGSSGAAGAGGSAGAAGSGGGSALPRHNEDSPLGTNLSGIADWSGEWAFVDAFKMSRPWVSGSSSEWDDGRDFDLDDHGWVRSLKNDQIARTIMFVGNDGHYPSGQYVVFYEGSGTIEYWAGATKNDGLSSPGRDVVDVDASAGQLGMNITEVDSSDHLRNIRLIMPGGVCSDDPYAWCEDDGDCGGTCESFEDNYETQIFHPTFLDRIKTYRMIRYMDWMHTNGSELSTWEDRPKLDDARWRRYGVPVEIMVELANRLSADPWFCMPHLADDDFVTEFATYVAQSLDAERSAYVEHSNEVWNGMFDQAQYAKEQGKALGLSNDDYQAQLYYHARRSVEMFGLWEQAFGSTDRLVRVLASQSANPWTADQVLSFEDAHQHADALAIAPYFGWNAKPSEASEIGNMTLDEMSTKIETETLPNVIQKMHDNKAKADEYGVALIAYEGGQHFVGVQGGENEDAINEKFDAMNRDPRMGTFYTTYFEAWKDAGGQDFAHFVNCSRWSKWGRWGALEWVSQPRQDAPKYDALQSFIEDNPRWW